MKRKIIEINQDLCNGCGQCVTACIEGAIKIINGKAQLVSDSYCDGLGTCIGHCPQKAIKITEKNTLPFNEKAAKKTHCQCSGSTPKNLQKAAINNWPVQITLIPETADYFENANLLIAADCTGFAYLHFHQELLQDKKLLIGCPKLDDAAAYTGKISAILKQNNIKSITVARMEVPCCKSLTHIVKAAITMSGKNISLEEIIVSVDEQRR